MTIEELWELPFEDFNHWRRENDLKLLFEHFEKVLPLFSNWLAKFSLSVEYILSTDQPGKFFHGKYESVVYETNEHGFMKYSIFAISGKAAKEEISKTDANAIFFEPYIYWSSNELKRKTIIPGGISGEQENFIYGLYQSDEPSSSQAFLCTGFKVLKLGGVTINGFGKFLLRNLDFCNLDFLNVVDGKYDLSRESNMHYSTLRNLIVEAQGRFCKFVRCNFQNLKIENSDLYGFEFEECNIFKASVATSRLSDILFYKCPMSLLNFIQVSVARISYIPPNQGYGTGRAGLHEAIAEINKSFRILYQNNGMRKEAASAYYFERLNEMYGSWFGIRLWSTLKRFQYKYFKRSVLEILYQLKRVNQSIFSTISYLAWGFGERPGRIVVSALFVIMTYAMLFFESGIDKASGNIFNSVYLSIVTFTTLGFGDITPINEGTFSKILVSSEALLGAFLMGLLVAGYSNKSKY